MGTDIPVQVRLCACHGEPMQRNSKGHWRCYVKQLEYARRSRQRPEALKRERERQVQRRENLREQGLCIYCGAPRLSETRCWDCLNKQEEAYGIRI